MTKQNRQGRCSGCSFITFYLVLCHESGYIRIRVDICQLFFFTFFTL
ncbi:hypothetical protein HanRHA438_Chr03g0100881 [Helianthus annuus]|nr:hypothetical protein HanRHA438_Chr03g0100881 [Helianthus annuus]